MRGKFFYLIKQECQVLYLSHINLLFFLSQLTTRLVMKLRNTEQMSPLHYISRALNGFSTYVPNKVPWTRRGGGGPLWGEGIELLFSLVFMLVGWHIYQTIRIGCAC